MKEVERFIRDIEKEGLIEATFEISGKKVLYRNGELSFSKSISKKIFLLLAGIISILLVIGVGVFINSNNPQLNLAAQSQPKEQAFTKESLPVTEKVEPKVGEKEQKKTAAKPAAPKKKEIIEVKAEPIKMGAEKIKAGEKFDPYTDYVPTFEKTVRQKPGYVEAYKFLKEKFITAEEGGSVQDDIAFRVLGKIEKGETPEDVMKFLNDLYPYLDDKYKRLK